MISAGLDMTPEIGDIVRLLGEGLPEPTGSEVVARRFREDLFTFISAKPDDGASRAHDSYLRASGLYKVCARREAIFCARPSADVPTKTSVGLQLTFDIGKAIHHLYQNYYLGPMGRLWGDWFCARCDAVVFRGTMPGTCPRCDVGRSALTYHEMRVIDHRLRYSGHPDGLLVDSPTDVKPRMVGEIKSVSTYQYKELRNGPQTEHVIQVHAYMRLLKLSDALLIYADKGRQADWTFAPDGITAGTPHVKVFHVRFDHAFWAEIERRIEDFWRAQALMVRDEAPTDDDVTTFCRVCESEYDDLARNCPARSLCFKLAAP